MKFYIMYTDESKTKPNRGDFMRNVSKLGLLTGLALLVAYAPISAEECGGCEAKNCKKSKIKKHGKERTNRQSKPCHKNTSKCLIQKKHDRYVHRRVNTRPTGQSDIEMPHALVLYRRMVLDKSGNDHILFILSVQYSKNDVLEKEALINYKLQKSKD